MENRPDSRQGVKKKRRRIHLNCEECRRTKSKCNRSWPCSECVKKGLAHICPNQVSKVTQPKSVTIAELTSRVQRLEDALKRHGLEHELDLINEEQEDDEGDNEPTRRPSLVLPLSSNGTDSAMDMAAMLGRLTLGQAGNKRSKRYAGMETTAFYLSSPSASEDEDLSETDETGRFSRSRRVDAELWRAPWGRSRGVSLTGRGHLPGVLLDRCRAMLCSRRAAKDMFEQFWDSTSWRIQPMTPAFFETVLTSVYDSPEGAHPHDLAVLFATQAMSMLFGTPTPVGSPFQAVDYHQAAYSCLVAGNFYTETTLSSLVCIHLLGSFLINSDDKRLPDGIFTIVGLGIKLAVIAGYHRDTSSSALSLQEIDWRRRIWHELLALERVHCMTALLPGSISKQHYDTPFPTDAHREGYFWWKWKLGLHMARVFDYWTSVDSSEYSTVQDIDAGLRRFLHALPAHLRCSSFPIDAFPLLRPGAPTVFLSPASTQYSPPPLHTSDYPTTLPPERLIHQQYRMATHVCMVFFYLHRPCFMRALASGDNSSELSVRTVIEVCERMLELVRGILNYDGSMSRWFSFAADLFSVLLCQTVLVVKTTEPALAQSRMVVLESGLAVLEWTATAKPNSKNRALVQRTRRLVATAQQSLSRLPHYAVLGPPLDPDQLSKTSFVLPSIPFAPSGTTIAPTIPIPTSSFTAPPTSTPSEGSSLPWPGFELNDTLGFTMPPVPSTNDDQFDAWLATLFPPPDPDVSIDTTVGPHDFFLDPNAWPSGA